MGTYRVTGHAVEMAGIRLMRATGHGAVAIHAGSPSAGTTWHASLYREPGDAGQHAAAETFEIGRTAREARDRLAAMAHGAEILARAQARGPVEPAGPVVESSSVTYPRRDDQGRTVWACCESSIGPVCQHRTPPAAEPDPETLAAAETLAAEAAAAMATAEDRYRRDDMREALATYGRALVLAGFRVWHSTSGVRDPGYLTYCEPSGRFWGTLQRSEFDGWDHLMPMIPSREYGSSMHLDRPAHPFTVRAAVECARAHNSNRVIGRHSNAGARTWVDPNATPLHTDA